MLHYIHRLDYLNTGDLQCGYYKYFDELYKFNMHIHDIENVNIRLISKNDFVIIGGGGLLDAWDKWNDYINQISNICDNVIIWSAGFNDMYDVKQVDNNINFNKIKLISIRDYSHKSGFQYVPCATCMIPYLKIKEDIKREIGIISHYHYRLNYGNYDTIYNSDNILNILRFISQSEVIISNSYHAIYWATLMNKRVILMYKTSSRFDNYKYPPQKYTGDIYNDINNSKIYNFAMDEAVDLTINYFNDVLKILNFNENKLYNISYNKMNYIENISNFFVNEYNYLYKKIDNLEQALILSKYDIVKSINENNNWIKLFGIYSTKEYLIFYFFGIKISFRINEQKVNNLAWWIPIRKWRDNFRSKFFDKFIGGGVNISFNFIYHLNFRNCQL